MILSKDKIYILRFKIKEYELVYKTKIINDDGIHITFKDKHNIEMSYNHSLLLTAEEVTE